MYWLIVDDTVDECEREDKGLFGIAWCSQAARQNYEAIAIGECSHAAAAHFVESC